MRKTLIILIPLHTDDHPPVQKVWVAGAFGIDLLPDGVIVPGGPEDAAARKLAALLEGDPKRN